MSRITLKPFSSSERSSDDVDELVAAIERAVDRREGAIEALSSIDQEISDALVRDEDGTFAEANDLDRRKMDLRRTVAQADLVLPVLEARKARAEAERRDILAASHVDAAKKAYEALHTALLAALTANEAAARAFAAAEADLGAAAGGKVPRTTFVPVSGSAVAYWSAAIEEALGRRPRKTLVPPPGIPVRFISHNVRARGPGAAATYAYGDVASFDAVEAERLCKSGAATPINKLDEQLFRPDPRHAAAPEPDDNGRLMVVFGRSARGPDGSAYGCGDTALFDAATATGFVRSGVAEFLSATKPEAAETNQGTQNANQ